MKGPEPRTRLFQLFKAGVLLREGVILGHYQRLGTLIVLGEIKGEVGGGAVLGVSKLVGPRALYQALGVLDLGRVTGF